MECISYVNIALKDYLVAIYPQERYHMNIYPIRNEGYSNGCMNSIGSATSAYIVVTRYAYINFYVNY